MVIIGAGQAAGRAIEAMRTQGYKGPITLIGEEPELPYERPALSKEVLVNGCIDSVVYIHNAAWYIEHKVTLILGISVTSINPANKIVECSNQQIISYQKLLITTGSKMRELNLPGAPSNKTHYLRTLQDAKSLLSAFDQAKSILVIGGGFIGLEVAASARKRGIRVSLVETGKGLMGRAIPKIASDVIAQKHRDEHVDIYLENTPVHVRDNSGDNNTSPIQVTLRDGTEINVDFIVVGIGVLPNVAIAEQAGLVINNGILTDSTCRTSDPDIYAAGDCANQYNNFLGEHIRLESWQNAQNQAIFAAQSMCGLEIEYAATPWFWSDQYDLNIQVAGHANDWKKPVLRGDPKKDGFMMFSMKNGVIKGAIGINAGRDMSMATKLIEGQKPCSSDDLSNIAISMKKIFKTYR
jgi:NADPH-dependent 2,4-dienoyl-CoA reductase/sulfur reductase-like enzyme